jgi:hypothetical protein
MDSEILRTMRAELAESRKGLGLLIGVACFVGLSALLPIVPGLDVLMKTHDWPEFFILFLSAGVGWLAGSMRLESVRREIGGYDDDTLQSEHQKMIRKKLRSDTIFHLAVALILACFLFGRQF